MAEFITAADAAERLGVTVQTIGRYLRSGRIRGIKLGKDWRIPIQEFARLAQSPPATAEHEPTQQS